MGDSSPELQDTHAEVDTRAGTGITVEVVTDVEPWAARFPGQRG